MKTSLPKLLSACLCLLLTLSLFSQTTTFNYTGGIATYTVPAGVTKLTITAKGARGGGAARAGLGASMQGDFTVTPGQVLRILVGQEGREYSNNFSGGGGSFVANNATNAPLIVAGGGGGASCSMNGLPGTTSQNGTSGNGGAKTSFDGGGGINGGGGGGAANIDDDYLPGGGGGAGFYGNGGRGLMIGGFFCTASTSNMFGGVGGNGVAGGDANTSTSCYETFSYQAFSFLSGGQATSYGSFGGGGAARNSADNCTEAANGGGGGYSGGGGGSGNSPGGGGGSFNSGTNQVNTSGTQTGNGQVIIVAQLPIIPAAPIVSGSNNVCLGSSTILTASATGVTSPIFRWYTAPTGGSLVFTGASYTTPVLSSNTTLYVDVTDQSSSTSSVRTAFTVKVTSITNQNVTSSVSNLCNQGTATINLASSQLGINYTLRNNADNTVVAGPIAGNGSAISFNTGNINTTTTYNVLASTNPSGALLFGSTGTVVNNDLALNISSGFTIEGWVYLNNTSGLNFIASQGTSNIAGPFDIYFANNLLNFWVGDGNSSHTLTHSGFNANTWYHIACVYDATADKQYIYVNGVLATQRDVTVPVAKFTNAKLIVGGRADNGASVTQGRKLDDVRIWNKPLSQTQIAESRNTCISTPQNGLTVYYPFDDVYGSTIAKDESGNGLNGTLTNIDPATSWTTGQLNCAPTCSIVLSNRPTITVSPNPTVTIAAVGGTTACPGNAVTLNATAPVGSTYQWFNGGVLISGATTASYNATVSGSYTAVAINNGCTSVASNAVVITITDVTAPVITCTAPITVTATSAAGAVVNYVTPVGTDNCSGANTTRTAGLASGSIFPIGTTTVTYKVTDASGNATNCSFDVTVTAPPVPASSLNFDGQNDHVTINNPFRSFGKAITVEFWMNSPTGRLAQGSVMGQSSLNVDGMTTNVWLMHPDIGGTNIDFYVNDAGTWRSVTVPIRAGGWHHYVGVASEFGTKFYVDGVLEQTGPGISNGILNNANSILQIGKDPRHTNFRFADMSIDEVRIWSRALCEDEIINNKNCELNPTGQNSLQEYYRFNQGFVGTNNSTETSLTDLSGNNRNGTLSGFALTGNNSNWVQSGFVSTANCSPYTAPIAPIAGNASLCIGGNSTLTNTIAGGLWSSSNTAVATINANSGVVNALSAGTTTITYRTECGGVATRTVTVNAIPSVTIAAVGGTSGCPSSGVTLNATAPNGSTYQWFKNGALINGASGVSYNATSSGSYTAVATNNGCVSTVSNTVVITITDVTPPTITCPSNKVLASCDAVIPDYTTSVTATDNCTASNAIVITQSPAAGTPIAPGATVTITLTATDALNNTRTCTFTANRPNVTPVAVNDNATICAGGSVNIGVLNNDTHPQGLSLTISDHVVPSVGTLVKNANNTFTYTAPVGYSGPVTFTYTTKANDGTQAFNGNGHYYEFVSAPGISWTDARAAASARTFNGLQGYLVTITSAAENAFMFNKVGNTAWIGGSDAAQEGIWKWVDGPEAGQQFSAQNKTSSCGATVPSQLPNRYHNWGAGEPNDCGGTGSGSGAENYAHFRSDGLWNDFPNGASVSGYAVEYGGLENCIPQLTATATVTINVTLATATIAAVGGTSACPGNSVTLNATALPGSTYQWFKDAVVIPNASGASYNATVTGSYTAVVTNNGCVSAPSNAVIVTIADAIQPTITCPVNQVLNLDASCKATVPDYRNLLTATDNCTASGSLVITQSPAAGTVVNDKGGLIITFTVTDAAGNSNTCTMSVDKKDVTAPVMTCTAPITVNNTTNTCGAVVNYINPSATDNCTGGAFNFFSVNEPNNYQGLSEDYIQLYTNGTWNDLPNSSLNNSIVEFNDIRSNVYSGYTLIGTFGGHTYYMSTSTASWTSSRSAAQAIGGDLASINTLGESSFLAPYGGSTWVGGYKDKTVPGFQEPGDANQNFLGWKWVDGTKLGAGQIVITQIAGLPSGSVFPVGVTTNTFTATDESGNTSTCSFTVTVRDVQPPVINCPANITVTATSASGAVVNYTAPVGTDNCGGATTVRTAGLASGATFPLGTTTVTYLVTDAANNSTSCSFTVTVSGLAPVIVSPGNQTVQAALGTCGAVVNFAATETTGVPSSTITYSIPSGSTFAVGSTVVTATATNVVGSSFVEFTVIVTDNEKPVIATCPVNQTINLDASCNATLPDYRNLLTATDNCTAVNNLVITQSPAAGTVVNGKGALIITFTVTDAAGNSSTCTMSVDKKDVTAPVMTCTAPITVNNTPNTCGAVVNYINPSATDNCTGGAFNFFSVNEPNNYQGLNEDYIQLYNNGTWNDLPNSSLNRSIVEFNDIRSNVYSGYTLIGTFGGHTYYISTGSASWTSSRSAAQAIGGDLASINTLGESSFLAPYGGSTWVGGYQDKTVPGFQEPGNANQNFLGWKWVDGTKLGAGQIVITQTAGLPAGSVFPVGVTTNTFTATDESGNTSTCSFTVTVRDVQPPVISCPANITVTATSASGAVVNYTAPVGTDNCGAAVTVRTAGLASGETFPIGTTTVTYRVTDAAGLTNQCSFNVTVVGVPPVINCLANITVNAANGLCAANVNFAATETTGIPASVITYTIDGNPVVSGASFPVGTTMVVATATNAIGSTSCSFTITVVDDQKPTISAPSNVQGNNTPGLCTGTVNLGTPVTGDNCGVASVNNDAPTTFPVGTTVVTWTVKDVNGNSATATQTVVIADNERPTITAPANVQGNNTAGLCTGTVNLGTPVTGDNCGVTSVNNDAPTTFPVGTTVVTWTVTDIHGNTTTVSQTVVITDNEQPTITAPANVQGNNTAGLCTGTVNLGTPVTGDNCGVASVTNDAPSVFPVGTTTVTWTVTDVHGNTATATQTVVVNDTELPVVVARNIVIELAANGQASVTPAQINNGSTDNCGIASIALSKMNFDCSNVGANTVVLTVTDIHGNTSTANATVTVQDNINPTVITKSVTVTLVNGAASVTADQVNDGSLDNCGIATMTVSPASFNCNNIGTNTVVLTVTDVNGNTATKTAIVTVVGQLPSCSVTSVPTSNVYTGGNPKNIYLGYGAQSTVLNVAATGGSSYTYQWSGNAIQMLSSTTAVAPVFTPTAAGNYTFTVTVTNNFGCTSTCSITICVKDIRVPGTGLKGSPAKVYICHLPPGNNNNPQTLEISVNAVATHIGQHAGDRLGTCAMTACAEPPVTAVTANKQTAKIVSDEPAKASTEEELKVTVMPNPTSTHFTLKLESKFDQPVNMRVLDVLGRVIDSRVKLGSNATIQIGHSYHSGTYFAEFIQGNKRKVVQLMKIKGR